MSIKWMYEELVEAKLDGTALLLVLDLSLHANAAAVCRTSVKKLVEYSGLSEKRVRKLLRTLHERGYLTVTNPSNWTLEIRVNCLQMLLGDPAVDGSPVFDVLDAASEIPLSQLSAPHIAPNWN